MSERIYRSERIYKHYVLAMVTLVYTLNSLDGGLMALLLQPIKQDLGLTDTQLGALTGIAFGFFYATLGIPIARWADRGNRPAIIAIASGLWGITLMSCLFVTRFVQLVFARVAAGVGESGCLPSTYSLVGDYFPAAAERTRAMSIYMLANPLAALISFIAGGWLNELYGWRVTFLVMGIPALVVAVLVKMTIAEPRRQAVAAPQKLPPMKSVLVSLWRQRSSRHIGFAIILLGTMGNGLGPWYAAFMMRSHDMNTAELGLYFGVIFGLSGICGILLGGYLATRWFPRQERSQMRLAAVSVALLVPCFIAFLLSPSKRGALAALFILQLVFSLYAGPIFAVLQRLVVDEMRATTLAVVMFLANLIGLGIGPQIVGVLSDLLRPVFGSDSLRYAMLAMSLVALAAAYCFWQVGRTVEPDLAAVGQGASSEAVKGLRSVALQAHQA
jgi:MFS family permease